jgi:serine/threonine protein kinase
VDQVVAPVKPGDVLAQKYRVERVLGAGAMGVVVAATHLELGSRVALKFMLPMALSGAEAVDRFMKEARAAGQLSSQHVCRVTDVGRLENGAPYIVMEYLEGKDLHELLREQGPLPIAQACDFVIQVCDAMSEAHAAGIVHRDLKPQNLFVTRKRNGQNVVKVLDFGISKATTGAAGVFSQTHTAAILGSPAYMSPEQLRSSKSVDGRADLWALGVILYQLMLGRYPFEGEDFLGLAFNISSEPPLSPRTIRPEIPEPLEAVILRCLEKDRERRFASADDLAVALSPFAAVQGRAITESATALPRSSSAVLDATMAPPSLSTAPGMVSSAASSSMAGAGATRMPSVPGVASAASGSFRHNSTLGAAAGQVDRSFETEPALEKKKRPLAAILLGGGVVAAAVVAFVVFGGGGKGAGPGAAGVTTPVAAPALVDAPHAEAVVATPPPAALPDAAVAAAPVEAAAAPVVAIEKPASAPSAHGTHAAKKPGKTATPAAPALAAPAPVVAPAPAPVVTPAPPPAPAPTPPPAPKKRDEDEFTH